MNTKRCVIQIVIVVLVTSPIWGYFIVREASIYVLCGPRLTRLALDLAEGNEALVISTEFY